MTTLNCSEFETGLMSSVESRAAVDDRFRAHAAACDVCAHRLEDHQVLDRAVREWNATMPTVELADGVVARWRTELAQPAAPLGSNSNTSTRPTRGVLTVVSAVVLMMAVALLLSRPGDDTGRRSIRPDDVTTNANTTRDGNIAAQAEDEVDVTGIVADLNSQFSRFRKDVSTMMAGVKVEWPAIDPDPLGTHSRSSLPKATNSGKPSDWQSSLSPIPRDVRKAFGFLKDAVPRFDRPST